ncbi:bicyclomycin resistance protein [Ktedonobacter sp. SOSP1-52]|uniref:ABC transporter substrate-binding protein n=1 Tax=Ktedonobacter sp. SOSP1-52 TaxID=2778366 RepID=UPI0019150896|nr:sugar ABC transporter substrate-binding protein [Ktedonobacter sp. SOSP1-52]GHO63838.1 bicyclomycin resistance protein [Ktedonobacter sp. SOSP1-52]
MDNTHESQSSPRKERPYTTISRRDALKLGGGLTSTVFAVPMLLSACGGTGSLVPSSSSADKTLRVYWNAGHAYTTYQQVISQFEKDHPGWKVKLELYQWPDMRTKVLANFAAGDAPDLIEEPGGWVQEFGLAGKLHSLQPYLAKDGASLGFPNDWQSYTVERNTVHGEVYGIQLHLTCMLLFYNKELLHKSGHTSVPATWEEFLEISRAVTANNQYGFAANQDSGYSWPWYLQNDVHLYDPTRKALAMDTPAAAEALQFQSDLIHKYKVAPVPVATGSYDGPQKLLSAGRAAFIITGPWDIKPILGANKDFPLGIAQALKKSTQATSAAGTSLMIPKAAKNPDMAWELMKRLLALETEVAVTKEASMTMPRLSWSRHPDVQKLELIAPFAKGLSYAQFSGAQIEKTGKSGPITSLFDKSYQDVIYKQTPASEALKAFTEAGNKVLSQ